MIQTILFATDMGVHTHYLLHHVNNLAQLHSANVVVVHAIEPPGHLGDAVVKSYLGKDTRREFAEDGIGQIIAGVKRSIIDLLEDEFIEGQQGLSKVSDVRVVRGKPSDVILQQAQDCGADLIIVGSHGQDTVEANMLGAVTSRLLQISRIPVYMVPLVRNILPQEQLRSA